MSAPSLVTELAYTADDDDLRQAIRVVVDAS